MPSNPGRQTRRRLGQAGDRLLTVMGDWTAPGPPDRPGWSDDSMSILVRVVTAAAGVVILLAMLIIWLVR
ncbi:hypothetical protein [Actinoplanes utahensis]|uniref:hypothetical protein n=1 Tax=Actinoplanes utahensis TaxID=1869 RepID=UPI001269FE74|nr:hypothetical protein [Actinoplanes utahensis]